MTNSFKNESIKGAITQFTSLVFYARIKFFIFSMLIFCTFKINAQCSKCVQTDTTNSILIPGTIQRAPIPYSNLREGDVMWAKRIWRTIDLREKLNQPYYYPEVSNNGSSSLFDLIKCGVLQGCIYAFDNPVTDDEFKDKMELEEIASLLIQKEIVELEDPNNPGTYFKDTITLEISSTDIIAYWIKEEWFFDKQRSVMDVRIIGLCPLSTKKDPTTGEVLGFRPLFWVYFPQLRPILAKQRVFVQNNFSTPSTYDDLFQKRYFSSYIHKESNVFDRTINSYMSGVDAVLESEKIKESISNLESDLWQF